MSATDLATEAGSSSAAVIRFCRSIGIKGFTELKLQLSADSQGIKDNLYTDILADENLEQVKKKMLINTNHLLKKPITYWIRNKLSVFRNCFMRVQLFIYMV